MRISARTPCSARAAFRCPAGSTGENLARLDALVATHRPESIVFLGDLLHARESHADETLERAVRVARETSRAASSCWSKAITTGTRARCRDAFGVDVVKEPYVLGTVGALPSSADGGWRLRARRTRASGVPARDAHRQRAAAVLSLRRALGRAARVRRVHRRLRGQRRTARGEAIYVVAGERVFGAACSLSDRSSSMTCSFVSLPRWKPVPAVGRLQHDFVAAARTRRLSCHAPSDALHERRIAAEVVEHGAVVGLRRSCA